MEHLGRIIRAEDPSVRILKSSLNDKRLTFKATGILARLLSNPNDHETSIKDLCNSSPAGLYSIKSGIKELVTAGYMELKSECDSTRKVIREIYIISD